MASDDAFLGAGESRGPEVDTGKLATEPNGVCISTSILRLADINSVAESFWAELIVHMWWFEEKYVEEPIKEDVITVTEDDVTIPALFYENATSVEDVDKPLIQTTKKKPGVIHWENRVRCTFHEVYELAAFPFDVQALTIKLRINSKTDEHLKRHVMLNKKRPVPDIKPDVELAEWLIYEPAVEAGDDSRGKPMQYSAHIPIRRRHEYFVQNIFGLMFVISSLGLTSFSIEADSMGDRASIVLTLLLTAVAFKFTLADALPKVPYATTFDVYVDSCFGLLALIMVQNAVNAKIEDPDIHKEMDNVFMTAISLIWLAWHVVLIFVIWLYLKRVKSRLGAEVNNDACETRVVRAQEVPIIPWKWHKATRLKKRTSKAVPVKDKDKKKDNEDKALLPPIEGDVPTGSKKSTE